MANILRFGKSSSNWTENDLKSYHIRVEEQDAATFFGVPELPQSISVQPEVLTTLSANEMVDDEDFKLINYMDLAMNPAPYGESAVDDFTVQLLKLLGYATRPRALRTRYEIPLFVCGEQRHAKADVCVIDENECLLLLVQENKRHLEDTGDPEPQLIAEAIAAFQYNNSIQAALRPKVIPGITMTGSYPKFYKIPVTAQLAESVSLGTFPDQETVVAVHTPDTLGPHNEGMRPLHNRHLILACYEAFKACVNW